jgi:hypothetical protein
MTVLRPITAALALLALAAPAAAMLAPEFYIEARRTAPAHVQIAVEEVETPSGGMGTCTVKGKVAKSFRGTMKAGSALTFGVACYAWGEMPNGPTLWTDEDALEEAAMLEAFMTEGPEPRILLDQVAIVPEARDTPWCKDDSLDCETGAAGRAEADPCSLAGRIWAWTGAGWTDCRPPE